MTQIAQIEEPSKTVLVTGAAGFIGSHTVDALLAAGHYVVGIDNFRTGKRENLSEAARSNRFRFIEGDLLNTTVLNKVCAYAKPNAVIHLAALVSVPESISHPEENFRLNVLATHVIGEWSRRYGVQRLVFASSAAVYGIDTQAPLDEETACVPQSPYGAAKLASEVLLLSYSRSFGLTVRSQRYFNVYGPRQDSSSPYSGVISRFAAASYRGERITIHGDGEQTRDFIAVSDVAEANARAATAPGLPSGTVNICTGRSISLNQLADLLGRLCGHTVPRGTAAARPGDIRHSLGSAERARRELNFVPSTALETGLSAYLASLRLSPPPPSL